MNHPLLWLAVVLIIIWVIARVALAVTSAFLHLLWVIAIIFLIVWLIKKLM
jgi:hypothetical protein